MEHQAGIGVVLTLALAVFLGAGTKGSFSSGRTLSSSFPGGPLCPECHHILGTPFPPPPPSSPGEQKHHPLIAYRATLDGLAASKQFD